MTGSRPSTKNIAVGVRKGEAIMRDSGETSELKVFLVRESEEDHGSEVFIVVAEDEDEAWEFAMVSVPAFMKDRESWQVVELDIGKKDVIFDIEIS